jgi:hypothetical protein
MRIKAAQRSHFPGLEAGFGGSCAVALLPSTLYCSMKPTNFQPFACLHAHCAGCAVLQV